MIEQEKLCEAGVHCFHKESIALLTYPPKYRKRCCHCGLVEIEQVARRDIEGTHGKYFKR